VSRGKSSPSGSKIATSPLTVNVAKSNLENANVEVKFYQGMSTQLKKGYFPLRASGKLKQVWARRISRSVPNKIPEPTTSPIATPLIFLIICACSPRPDCDNVTALELKLTCLFWMN
jgi:hypothetical protein